MTFPKEHRAKIDSTDEIDKSFCSAVLCWYGTGDRVAKSGAAAASPARLPDQMTFAASAAPRARGWLKMWWRGR